MQEKLIEVIEAVRQEGIEALRRHQARVAELEALLQAEKLAAARAEGLIANLPYLQQRIGAVITVDIDGPGKEDGGVSQTHTPTPEDFIEQPHPVRKLRDNIDGFPSVFPSVFHSEPE